MIITETTIRTRYRWWAGWLIRVLYKHGAYVERTVTTRDE